MIDNSVIKRLAIQCGFTPSLIFDAENRFNLFAQAVIEDYKAGLVPVAWLDEDTIVSFGHMKYGFIDRRDRAIPNKWQPLYALPSRETK